MTPIRSDSDQPTPDLDATKELQENRFPIVGIGASAGGLEAFQKLFSAMPTLVGMAFVVIQHLSPSHNSLLSEILTRSTSMPVREVVDGVSVKPNHVYVIPPNTKMVLLEGELKLLPREKVEGKYMPVDAFFVSLAEEWGSQAIAIVLSGGDGDGTIGVEAVKAAGGITFAQDLLSSKVPSMPRNATAGGHVDFVLPPAEIAKELLRLSRYPYLTYSLEKKTAEILPDRSDDSLSKIFALLRSTMGVDFTHYKQTTLKRRIMRRLMLHNLERLDDYVQLLQKDPAELELLYQDLLIKVTSFFRDPDSFEALKNTVFPQLIKDRAPDSPIRIWIAACATGEEAYSIAIALLEFLGDRDIQPGIQIFATDISNLVIEKARSGIYPTNALVNVSPDRLQRFFVPIKGGYQIGKIVRDLCIFARQDITIDPPFSRLDLVTCRNVLIYLGVPLQKKVMAIFHYALKPKGFLMLGTSETIGESSDLFTPLDRINRIYARKRVSIRLNSDVAPIPYLLVQSTKEELETAKEDIQAATEELNTINEELRSRNQELNQVNNDLQNLLSSVNIPILILDGNLQIRRFTPMAERLFNLIQTDVGRLFSDIYPSVNVPNLTHLILEVIGSLHVYEQEIQDTKGRWYSLRIHPYKTAENQIDGAVIGLIDIDELKRNTVELEKLRDYATAIVETIREPLIVLDANLRVITANQSFYQMFEVLPAQTETQSIFELDNGDWNQDQLRSRLEEIISRNTQLENIEVEQVFNHIGRRTLLLNVRKTPQKSDSQMILLAIEDITDRKLCEGQIRSSLQEKEVLLREVHHRVKNNLQIISSMLGLQSNRVADLQVQQNFLDSQNRVRAMALLHEILYQSDDLAALDLANYFQSLMTHLFRSYSAQANAILPRVIVQPDLSLIPDKAVLCGLIINELVTNALKHGFPDGRTGEICITIAEVNRLITLIVSNNGIHLPDNFTLENLPSMGLNLVINLVQQLHGELEFDRTPIFKVTFPT